MIVIWTEMKIPLLALFSGGGGERLMHIRLCPDWNQIMLFLFNVYERKQNKTCMLLSSYKKDTFPFTFNFSASGEILIQTRAEKMNQARWQCRRTVQTCVLVNTGRLQLTKVVASSSSFILSALELGTPCHLLHLKCRCPKHDGMKEMSETGGINHSLEMPVPCIGCKGCLGDGVRQIFSSRKSHKIIILLWDCSWIKWAKLAHFTPVQPDC